MEEDHVSQALAKDRIYRVVFDTVRQDRLKEFCDADPATHSGTSQVIPNSRIPEDAWYRVEGRATDNPWEQYRNLRLWAAQDREFVRNVQLERLVMDNPRWVTDR